MSILLAGRAPTHYRTRQTPIGEITIAADPTAITHLEFHLPESVAASCIPKETPLIRQAFAELEEYFQQKRQVFDLLLAPTGTPFQRLVWEALLTIPYGETRSYQEIAAATGNPKACRAVGMANNRNPISIIIPCHRVIGKNGSLVGYGGGLDIKRRLLELESGGHRSAPAPR